MLRISATIPDDLIATADARAKAQRRSRSWVLSEALREYLAREGSRPLIVREPTPDWDPSSSMGLGPSRTSQLEADLRLTPAERVKEAEQTLRLTDGSSRPPRQVVILFDSFDDYLEWDRHDGLR